MRLAVRVQEIDGKMVLSVPTTSRAPRVFNDVVIEPSSPLYPLLRAALTQQREENVARRDGDPWDRGAAKPRQPMMSARGRTVQGGAVEQNRRKH